MHFDNSEGHLPVDRATVVVKRAVGLRKDEYFLDGKHATKTEIASLLESAGLSRSNPTHIVPQGRVMALTTMKDSARLALLREVSGTSTYDARRQESMQIMEDANQQKRRITDSLGTIEARLKALDAEKAELARYRALERQRRIAEYVYHHKDQAEAETELEKIETQRRNRSGASSELEARVAEAQRLRASAEEALGEAQASLRRLQEEGKASNRERLRLTEAVTRLQLEVEQHHAEWATILVAKASAEEELKEVDRRIDELGTELAAGRAERERAAAETTALEAERQACMCTISTLVAKQGEGQRFQSEAERNACLDAEASALRDSVSKAEEQARALEQLLAQSKSKADKEAAGEEAALIKLDAVRSAAAVAARRAETAVDECAAALRARDTAREAHAEASRAARKASEEAQHAEAVVQRLMPRTTASAASTARLIATEKSLTGVYGLLIELFTPSAEAYHMPIETIGGMALYHLVVDTDETAAVLLNELQRRNAGRLTIMPLTQMARALKPLPEYPQTPDAVPLLHRIKFDPKFRPAMAHVFGRTMVVKNLEVGAQLAKVHGLEGVTVDGDRTSISGALTGGYVDHRHSRLDAYKRMGLKSEALKAKQHDCANLKQALDGAERAYEAARSEMSTAELDAHRTASEAEQQAIEVGGADGSGDREANGAGSGTGTGTGISNLSRSFNRGSGRGKGARSRTGSAAMAQNERALAALREAARVDEARLEAIAQQRSMPFVHALSEAEREQLSALQQQLHGIEKRCVAAARFAANLESEATAKETEMSENLQRRRHELVESIEGAAARAEGRRQRDGDRPEKRRRKETTEAVPPTAEGDAAEEREAGEGKMPDSEVQDGAGSATADEKLATLNEELATVTARFNENNALLEAARSAVTEGRDAVETAKAAETAAVAKQASEARESERLLAKRSLVARRVEAAEAMKRQVGTPSDEVLESEEATSLRALKLRPLWQRVESYSSELAALGHVNKKAHDQYTAFTDQREALRARRREVDEGEAAISQLVAHLDGRKQAALAELFDAMQRHFREVFSELVPGGKGEMIMLYGDDKPDEEDVTEEAEEAQSASNDKGIQERHGKGIRGDSSGDPVGVAIKVRFAIGGDTQTMSQLSGGQKTMVALCLIFAIQRCDPAPFYIFDEIDAALDATHRAALASMIERQASPVDEHGNTRRPTQFITTTFRPELIAAGNQFYGVSHVNKASTIRKISMAEAHRIITEGQSRARQHAGGAPSNSGTAEH